jgi:hypothetical protein
MRKNMGTADRLVRTAVAAGIGVLYATGRISGTLALVLGAFAVVFVLTSAFAWCPLYSPLGLSTRR